LLCEGSGTGAHLDAVVVGIGVNVSLAAYPPELAQRATSLEAELGRPIDRATVVVECLAGLAAVADMLRSGETGPMLDAWRQLGRAGLNGAPIRWIEQGAERRGFARDIDVDGALLVDTDAVEPARLIAGEVTWERLSRG